MLKMTKIELELITDPDMYIFFEKSTRGGISNVSNRYSKANIIYLKSYDSKQESNHIIYLDASNLYGYAMYKFFPTSELKSIDHEKFDLNKYTSNCSKGCVLEVDIEYPKELRILHNDYPSAPDKTEIKIEILFEYQVKIADSYNIPVSNVTKSVLNSFCKEKYVLHYEHLQLYLRLVLKLKKYCVLKFNQSQWLKPYIEFNT